MARIRIEFHSAGLREALRTPQVVAPLQGRAEAIASRAQSLAAAEAVDTGAYRDSIHTELLDEPGWERPRVRVIADDYKANWIENGYTTRGGLHVEGKRILGRAGDAT